MTQDLIRASYLQVSAHKEGTLALISKSFTRQPVENVDGYNKMLCRAVQIQSYGHFQIKRQHVMVWLPTGSVKMEIF